MYGTTATATRGEFIVYRERRFKLKYLCGYFSKKISPDILSRSILLFKRNHPDHVDTWVRYATDAISLGRHCLILRPLYSDEQVIHPDADLDRPLDNLCKHLSFRNACLYEPWLLRKESETPPLKGLKRDKRWKCLEDQYSLTGTIDPERVSQILLVDDIITTGTTFRILIRLLQQHYPQIPVMTFALARTSWTKDEQLLKNELGYNQWFSSQLPMVHEPAETYVVPVPRNEDLTCPEFDNSETYIISP